MKLNLGKRDIKDLDNISLTAYRIISILNMLLESPCSDKEINEKLQNDIIGARSLSQDTICIYINTLRAIGCQISRPSKNNEYKYVLKSHPFNINLDQDEILTLIETRKYISNLEDWKLLVGTDRLFNLINENLNYNLRKQLNQIRKESPREITDNHQINIINMLEKYCNNKRTLLINYLSPESGDKSIEIAADKLSYENGAFYLWGHNVKFEETQYLRVDRIKEIKAVNIQKNKNTQNNVIAKYKLTGISALMFSPGDDEIIIEKSDNNLIIETKIKSKFKFIQRILSYGSDCTIITPDSLKTELLVKLNSMLDAYN